MPVNTIQHQTAPNAPQSALMIRVSKTIYMLNDSGSPAPASGSRNPYTNTWKKFETLKRTEDFAPKIASKTTGAHYNHDDKANS
jgi:hypothetical protein